VICADVGPVIESRGTRRADQRALSGRSLRRVARGTKCQRLCRCGFASTERHFCGHKINVWRRDGQVIRLVSPRFERCGATCSQEFWPRGLKQASDYIGEGCAACNVECSIPLAVTGERLSHKSRIVGDLTGL
jgi:hypothetical protein